MKKIILSLAVPLVMYAHTMPELFDALKAHSQTQVDEMLVKKAEAIKNMSKAKLYPTVNLFAKYDNYNTPTGILPITPNKTSSMLKDQSIAQPLSNNIYSLGLAFNLPLFVKSIFTSAKKAQLMQESSQAKKRINILKNEALIVGTNANFLYLVALEKSLNTKEKSLLETKKTIKIKVNNGRASASTLYKIDDSLNQISISKNNILLQKKQVISVIETLTGIILEKPIEMQVDEVEASDDLASLKPMRLKLKAQQLNLKAQKEKLYPSLFAHGKYIHSTAKAYNNNDRVNEDYTNIGITLNIPIFAMNDYRAVKKAKVEYITDRVELKKMTDELSSTATMLVESIPLLDNSMKLYKKSVDNKNKLLAIAKVNYNSGRLSTEEYLRYEDDVVLAKANYYKAKTKKIQTQMRLAVIYANNIEEMIR